MNPLPEPSTFNCPTLTKHLLLWFSVFFVMFSVFSWIHALVCLFFLFSFSRVFFPLCFSLRYLTRPLPSSLTSPVPHLVIIVSVFGFCQFVLWCSPCSWFPHLGMSFLMSPVWYVLGSYFFFWFVLHFFFALSCYSVFVLVTHFVFFLLLFFLVFIKLLLKNLLFVSPISCLLCVCGSTIGS